MSRGVSRCFAVEDAVWVKTVRGETVSSDDDVVTQVVSPVTYLVKVSQVLRFTHADHIKARYATPYSASGTPVQPVQTSQDATPPMVPRPCGPAIGLPLGYPRTTKSATVPLLATTSPTAGTAASGSSDHPGAPGVPSAAERATLRRSERVRRDPDKYQPSNFRK